MDRRHILYVEDQPAVRAITIRQIEVLGHAAIGAASGREAMALLRESRVRVDLVITDYLMPDMSGLELAAMVRRIRADLPIVLFTGQSDALRLDEAQAAGLTDVRNKPVSLGDLQELLGAVVP